MNLWFQHIAWDYVFNENVDEKFFPLLKLAET